MTLKEDIGEQFDQEFFLKNCCKHYKKMHFLFKQFFHMVGVTLWWEGVNPQHLNKTYLMGFERLSPTLEKRRQQCLST